jgi:preprotein translocase subunit SecF
VQVASARRNRAQQASSVALAEREVLPGQVESDLVIESPASVTPESAGGAAGATASGATTAPRPGARPQRPGQRRPASKKRR